MAGVRAFASLLTSLPTSSTPPGREVAVVLSQALVEAGEDHEGPQERKGDAWGLTAARAGAHVDCNLTLADAGTGRWLLGATLRKSGLGRFAPSTKPEHEEALRAWCAVLQRTLSADGRFSDVRWSVPDGWDREGDAWARASGP